jgi:hypothetical protein
VASRSLGVLTLDLIAKTGGFERGMDKAARTAEQRLGQIQKRAKIAGAAIGAALVAGAGIVAAGVQTAINRMDEMSKAAQRAQLPTEQFSQLAYAASLADVSMQDLQTAFGRLAKAQGDSLKTTSEQGRIFKALGIEVADATGKLRSTRDVFLEFADVFQRNQGSPEVMAAGMAIFGRSFQNLIPLLKDGKQGLQAAADEADRLGITLSTEAGRAAEHFNDNITRLKTALSGMWQQIAVQVLPVLIRLSDEFVQSAKDGDRLASSARSIGQAIAGTIRWAANLHDQLVILRGSMTQLTAASQGFNPLARLRAAFDGGEFYRSQVAAAEKAAKDVEAARARIAGRNSPWAGVTGSARGSWEAMPAAGIDLRETPKAKSGGKSKAQQELEALERAYESMNARMDEQIALFGKTGEAAKLRYELEFGELSKLDAARKAELLDKAERLDLMEAERKALEENLRLEAEKARAAKQLAERQAGVLESMKFELSLYGMTNIERARAIALKYAEANATTELGRAIVDMSDQLYQAEQAQRVWDEFSRSLSDAFVDLATGAKSLKDVLKDFFDSIAAAITRSIAEQWAENITSWFKGAANNSGSGGGFNWGSLLSSLFGGGKASGGSVQAGKLYEVNERGTEMFSAFGRDYLLAGTAGHITPAHKVGGAQVTQKIYVTGTVDARTAAQMQQEAAVHQRRALGRNS